MLQPVKKTRLYEEIVRQFISRMKSGELKPGDRLPTERDLAIQLNVSRTAIREALRSMELMGLIDSKVGGGTFVKAMTLDNIVDPFAGVITQNARLTMEMIEIRLLLEVEVARLAARRIDLAKIRDLEEALELMGTEIAEGRLGIEGDNAFHNALANAADNLAMKKILGLCSELLSSTREVALKALGDPRIGLEQHRGIFQAVCHGDEEASAAAMKQHLQDAYRHVEVHG